MKLYHGTSKEAWEKIKVEGLKKGFYKYSSNFVFLTPDAESAKCFGEVVLEIDLDEYNEKYANDCIPHPYNIPANKIRRL